MMPAANGTAGPLKSTDREDEVARPKEPQVPYAKDYFEITVVSSVVSVCSAVNLNQ